MRHGLKGRKFNRDKGARAALLRALATSLFANGKIQTTVAKAKDIRPVVEKIVTKAKAGKGDLNAVRALYDFLYTKEAVENAFKFAEINKSRPGGYLRILKNGRRHGDHAPIAIISFVEGLEAVTKAA